MKKSLILAATVAILVLNSGSIVAAETGQGKSYTQQVKRCYRTVHKLPYRIRVKCPAVKLSLSDVAGLQGGQAWIKGYHT